MTREHCHLLITGGTGYIGTELTRAALAKGYTVTVAGRRRPVLPSNERVRYVPYALTDPLDPEVFKTVDAVIHLAADTSSARARLPEKDEIRAGIELLEAATAQGCRFVFASSQSASERAPAPYGRIKWHIEQAVLNEGGFVVRPGLVYGGARTAGVFGTLYGLVARLPVLPDLRPRPSVQPIFIRDLCEVLLRLACDPGARPGAYNVGDPRGISFTDFLRGIARYRVRKQRIFLPVPMVLFTALTRVQAMFPRLPGLGSERILGLAALPKMATQESLRQLDLELTPLHVGMIRGVSGARRLTASEGRALLGYVSGREPPPGLLRRYIRGVEFRHAGTPLPLPALFIKLPALLCLIDTNTRVLETFGWREFPDRLALAVALAEASPQGAVQFLQLKPRNPVAAWLGLLGVVVVEALVKSGQLVYAALSFVFPRSRSPE